MRSEEGKEVIEGALILFCQTPFRASEITEVPLPDKSLISENRKSSYPLISQRVDEPPTYLYLHIYLQSIRNSLVAMTFPSQ